MNDTSSTIEFSCRNPAGIIVHVGIDDGRWRVAVWA